MDISVFITFIVTLTIGFALACIYFKVSSMKIKDYLGAFIFAVVVFGFASYTVYLLGSSAFHALKDDLKEETHKTELRSKHSPATHQLKDLKRKADKWLNSYDDEKFSTSELYDLRVLQKLTGVKVYDNALEIQKVYNQENIKKFKESLFETRDSLEQGYVKTTEEESI